MNEEQNMPDELWRRVFDEAAETPPPRVWDAIERQLDKPEGGRVVPLWGIGTGLSRPVAWGTGLVAAATLLLIGWWLARTELASQQPSVARTQPTRTKQEPLAPEHAVALMDAAKAVTVTPEANHPTSNSFVPNEPRVVAVTSASELVESSGKRVGYLEQKTLTPLSSLAMHSALVMPVTTSSLVSLLASPAPGNSLNEPGVPSLVEPDRLASRGIRLYETRPIQRIVWFGAGSNEPKELAREQKRVMTKSKWASVSVMPGVFNPGVSVVVPAYANSLAYNSGAKTSNNSAVSSRGSVSVAIQASAGVQLSDRWSIESGIGYLAGRSTVESPGRQPVYNFAQSGIVNSNVSTAAENLYTDLLRSETGKANRAMSSGVANDLLISNTNQYAALNSYSTRQTSTSNYTYVQVPVQVGYELRPRKRLTLALLGGLITNIFVKNTVDDALVVKAGDGIYEPVALVASMGARFRYRSSDRWSASMAGMYQPAITPGTRSDSPVQNQSTTTGVTVGVDYHF